MITGMDRLVAAIKGETSDRIPVFCNLLDQGADELGMPLEEYYSNGENVAEAQLRMLKKYGHDNVWSLFYVGKEAELLGSRKMIYAKDGPPNMEDFVIKSLDDVGKLEVPDDLTAHPAFESAAKCLKILKSEVGGKNPICAYITATMMLPALLMGFDNWMELLFNGPVDVREELLAKCHDFFVKETAAYRDAGANVVVYSNPFGSSDTKMQTPEFTKSSCCALPLLVGSAIVGVLKMEDMLMSADNIHNFQPYFGYAALVLQHEIESHSRLTLAYDRLCQANDDLKIKMDEQFQQAQFLKAIFESIDAGVVVCDATGTLTMCNRKSRELHSLAPDEVPVCRWAVCGDIYLPDGKTKMPEEDSPLFRALNGDQVTDKELIVMRPGAAPASSTPSLPQRTLAAASVRDWPWHIP
jgi:PAS domain-containing protein